MPNAMLKMHEACTILVAGIIMNYALFITMVKLLLCIESDIVK